MIQHRDSMAYLSKEEILARITEEDIFRRYCPNFVKVGKKFCSPLRQDRHPDVMIFQGDKGLIYVDYSYRSHVFDCIGYVMHLYSSTFMEALKIIDQDFKLGLTFGKLSPRSQHLIKVQRPVERAVIRIKRRDWKLRDKWYWESYGIDKKVLERFHVVPISHYWINGHRYHAPSLCYAYTEYSPRFKIYSPHESEFKWFSNTVSTDIQGLSSLPGTGNRVLLTSSLKDVMVLNVSGTEAVAFQSESQMPPPQFMNWLRRRYRDIEVFYDNDPSERNPGQKMAERICTEYGLRNIVIPSEFNSKDPSDLVEAHGPVTLQKILHGKEIKTTREEHFRDSGRDKVPVQTGSFNIPDTEEGECPF
jgi:hypothetical protein